MKMKIEHPKIYYAQLWGLRKDKYNWLSNNSIKTTDWIEVRPKSEFYLFVPREEKLLEAYEKNPKITDIFPLNSVGIVTSRDSFVIDTNKDNLLNRIRLFKNNKYSDDELHTFFQISKKTGWSIREAWNKVKAISDSDLVKFIIPVLYRPFDVQWIFYHDSVIERTRKEVMRHMMQDNLGLVTSRQVIKDFRHAFVFDRIANFNLIDIAGRFGSGYLFPLYLYPSTDKKDLFSHKKKAEKRQPNISPKVFMALSEVYKKEQTPEEIFYYIYAVLYSNIYRTKYAEFLKIDFPRIPFTKDYKLFSKMAEHGQKLVALHLMKPVGAYCHTPLPKPFAKFQGKGDNRVEKLKYNEEQNRVYINKDQYFEGIKEEVWQYQIGGYQVCDKWLKDRKGRNLSLDDIKHYCNIVTLLQETIEIQKVIDDLYSEVEKEVIKFPNDGRQ